MNNIVSTIILYILVLASLSIGIYLIVTRQPPVAEAPPRIRNETFDPQMVYLDSPSHSTDPELNTDNVSDVLSKSGLVAPGMIMMWHSSTPPTGWAICNGQGQLSDGSPVPDLQGRFIRGIDAGKNFGVLGGSDTSSSSISITLEASNLPPHSHVVKYGDHSGGGGHSGCQWQPTSGCQGSGGNWSPVISAVTETTGGGAPATAATPPFSIVPKYFSVYYIIKI